MIHDIRLKSDWIVHSDTEFNSLPHTKWKGAPWPLDFRIPGA
jgi:hypothetical protein